MSHKIHIYISMFLVHYKVVMTSMCSSSLWWLKKFHHQACGNWKNLVVKITVIEKKLSPQVLRWSKRALFGHP
jgi:hypothetical protein